MTGSLIDEIQFCLVQWRTEGIDYTLKQKGQERYIKAREDNDEQKAEKIHTPCPKL